MFETTGGMKMANTRIYEVPAEPKAVPASDYNKTFLVEAASLAAARNHVAAKYVGPVTIPKQKRVAELMGQGIKVEMAKED